MYYKELDVLESKHNGVCFSGKFICVGETISKDLVVKCPVCSEDPELFGDGLFVMPKCAGNEYNEAYINVISNEYLPIALKFGISNKAEKRIIKQKQGSIYNVEQLGVWKFDNTDSCKESEITIKRKIETSYLSKSEFADGYTETCHLVNLQTIIDTYESFGGILIS